MGKLKDDRYGTCSQNQVILFVLEIYIVKMHLEPSKTILLEYYTKNIKALDLN